MQRGTAFMFTGETNGSRYDLMVGRDDTNSWLIAVTNMGVSARVAHLAHLDDPGYLAEKLGIARIDAAQIIERIANHLSSPTATEA